MIRAVQCHTLVRTRIASASAAHVAIAFARVERALLEDADMLEAILATPSSASAARGNRRETDDVLMTEIANIDLNMFRRRQRASVLT